jgi:YD repeat-containing protein
MVAYTYNPLIGVTSQTDPSGKITYYEYDVFNRLKVIRDINKNIIKQFDYQYQIFPSNLVTISSNNFTANIGAGFTAVFTDVTSGQQYSFPFPTNRSDVLGSIPMGTYNLTMSRPGNTKVFIFGFGNPCPSAPTEKSGTSATFNNVVINGSQCNNVFLNK